MAQLSNLEPLERPRGVGDWLSTTVGRVLVSVFVPIVTFVLLYQVFLFLRDAAIPQWITAIIAIIWGVGGVLALFSLSNYMIEQLPLLWRRRLTPFVFVGPALVILAWYLLIPTLRSFVASLYDDTGENFVGLSNYFFAFTSHEMLLSFRNNFLFWMIFGTGFSVGFGLLIAVLADRTHPVFETICKALIFMPMVISGVGAAVIWRFVYEFRPPGSPQIGLLNGILAGFGSDPVAWLLLQPWNNLLLVAIMIWLQTGYSMVILSSAIKGVPADLYEAGRIDGANEFQIFRSITVPYIQGTILTVATTTILATLKVFDIVQSMTGGNFGTQVIANVQFTQLFRLVDNGRASAIAIILLIAVIPVMYYNVRQFGKQTEAF
ncbi:MAG TPA: sugar ABC transporter permease [Roseiflexaceae bacterium]|nr:sugar ABC transporter permease [Roseiflexaceae bacterium]